MTTASRDMSGRICMVTGATSGIGLATAEALARLGADVIIVGRNADKCMVTAERIKQQTGNLMVDYQVADLSSQADIRRLAEELKSKHKRLHVLVNNAGGQYTRRQESADGIEMTFALNHLDYFLLSNLLLDVLKAGAPSRIVNVASGLHKSAHLDFNDLQMRSQYHGRLAYNQSKLCNVLFTYELARRLQGTGVTANAAAPGLVRTNLGLQNGGRDALGKRFANMLPFALSPEKGAETVVYLASSPDVAGVTGKYFSRKQEAESSPESHDPQVAARLWKVSAEMTGIV